LGDAVAEPAQLLSRALPEHGLRRAGLNLRLRRQVFRLGCRCRRASSATGAQPVTRSVVSCPACRTSSPTARPPN
jgi:hypothetical protein